VWEREAFASSDDIRRATRLLDLVLAIFFTLCRSASVCARGCDRTGRRHKPLGQSRGLFSLRESHGLCDAPRKGCLFAGPYKDIA
jgi:hypothetical protein